MKRYTKVIQFMIVQLRMEDEMFCESEGGHYQARVRRTHM